MNLTPSPKTLTARDGFWLMIEVQGGGAAGSLGVDPFWRIEQLQVDIDATVRQQ